MFVRYFFEVWDRLEDNSIVVIDFVEFGMKLIYVWYLIFMSYYVYLLEGVDVVIYEMGIGGEYDVMNVVEWFVVSGISILGIDYVYVLGDIVDKIVWYKVGILKKGSFGFIIE